MEWNIKACTKVWNFDGSSSVLFWFRQLSLNQIANVLGMCKHLFDNKGWDVNWERLSKTSKKSQEPWECLPYMYSFSLCSEYGMIVTDKTHIKIYFAICFLLLQDHSTFLLVFILWLFTLLQVQMFVCWLLKLMTWTSLAVHIYGAY